MDVHGRELRYFVAVAEHLHFTRAAEALFVSQPALSKQIRALEDRLRAPLFVRDRRTVTLTPAGTALLPHARDVLAAWDRAEAALAAATTVQDATLEVGISTGLGRGLLPAVRARLAELAPHARLRVRQVPWDDPAGGLTATPAPADAAFVWLPLPDAGRFGWTVVVREPRLVALPTAHRLATRDVVTMADLRDEPFLALPADAGELRDFWLATDAREGHPPVVGAEVAGTDETVEALQAGLGVCLVAAGNAPLITRDDVLVRPVVGIGPAELALVWRRTDDRPLLAALRAAVRAATGAR